MEGPVIFLLLVLPIVIAASGWACVLQYRRSGKSDASRLDPTSATEP